MTKTESGPEHADRELVLTRVFDAPRELVWRAFTEPKHIVRWWGPRHFSTRVVEQDVRPGGRLRYVMVAPDGKEYPMSGVFLEVEPPARLVATDEFGEDHDHGDSDLPSGMVTSYDFEDLGDRTKLTLRIAHPTAEDRRKNEEMGVVAGWNSSFGCLDEYLALAQS